MDTEPIIPDLSREGVLPKPELDFALVHGMPRLKDALSPLSQKTGVDFFTLHHIKKEIPEINITDNNELAPFFQGDATDRRFYTYIDRNFHRERADAEMADFLITEETTASGHRVLAIFDYPGWKVNEKGERVREDCWRKIKIPGTGSGDKVKFTFLKLRFACVVVPDADDPKDRRKDTAMVFTDRLLNDPLHPRTVGLLSLHQEDSLADQFDAVITDKTFLVKDGDKEKGLLGSAEGKREISPYSKWLTIACGEMMADGDIRTLIGNLTRAIVEGVRRGDLGGVNRGLADLLLQTAGVFIPHP